MNRREECAKKIIKVCDKNTADAKIGLLVMDTAIAAIGRYTTDKSAITVPYWKEKIADVIIEYYPEIANDCDGVRKYCKDTANRRLIISDHKCTMAMALDGFADPRFAELAHYDGVSARSFRFNSDPDVLYAIRLIEAKFGNTVSPHISPIRIVSECKCKGQKQKPVISEDGCYVKCNTCGRSINMDKELTLLPSASGPVENVLFRTNFTKEEVVDAFRIVDNVITPVEYIGANKVYPLINLLNGIKWIYATKEADNKLYVYSSKSEKVLDKIADVRAARKMPITPVSKTEYVLGRDFMSTYDKLMMLNEHADLDNLEARMELKNELFALFCGMIVQNSEWCEKCTDGISDKYLDELTDLYLANTDILPTKQSRNDIAFKAFFEFAQDEEDIDAVTFGNNPKGGFTRFNQLDDMGIVDAGMRNNFFYHYLSVEYGSQMVESDPLTDAFMKKFKVTRVD